MRKKLLVMGMVATLLATATGCGNKYVSLGDYKNQTFDYTVSALEVTDADVEAEVKGSLANFTYEQKDKGYKAKDGDTVNIDYEGLKDGVAFEGGTAEGYDLVLGSNSFIDGFESGLVGAQKGQKLSLNLKFPKDYQSEELAGQKVVFKVKVNAIKSTPTMDEFNDEFVKSNVKTYKTYAGEEIEVATVDAYKTAVKDYLVAKLEDTNDMAAKTEVLEKVTANCEIKEYPEDQLKALKDDMNKYYEQYAQYYGVGLDEFIEQYSGYSKDEFYEEEEKSAKEELARRLVVQAIAEKEKLELTDEEYDEGVKEYVEKYKYESAEAMEKEQGKDTIKIELQKTKVQNWLLENNKMNAKVEDTTKEK